MILEFVGLPGAGKTTLCNDLRLSLASTESNRPSKSSVAVPRKPLRKAMGAIRNPRVALLAARALLTSPRSWHEKGLAARWFLATLSLYPPRNRSQPDLILDEGLLQRSFLIFLEQGGFGPSERVARYVEVIPLADIVIMVELTPAESLARLQSRERPPPLRFRTMTESDLRDTFSAGAELFDFVLARAQQRRGGSIQVIRIPGNDLDLAKQRLAVEIAERLARR